ncbi:hypothetical protein NOVO_08595 [Rickettsiales bacterium Ac37b]|nr:hypothetical protein NOVO_08595 [Rickettsiales bacterium Ac37b]
MNEYIADIHAQKDLIINLDKKPLKIVDKNLPILLSKNDWDLSCAYNDLSYQKLKYELIEKHNLKIGSSVPSKTISVLKKRFLPHITIKGFLKKKTKAKPATSPFRINTTFKKDSAEIVSLSIWHDYAAHI